MARSLSVFPPDETLRKEWLACFAAADYQIIPFEESVLSPCDIILLFTPVLTADDEWISPEAVWKNYFSDTYPSVKVVQTGYRNGINLPNYLHWGKPPEDIGQFISDCQPASEWESLDTSGLDLRKLWTKFRDGHDKGGFMDWYIVAKRRTKIALGKLIEDQQTAAQVLNYLNTDPETKTAFDNSIGRWKRYAIYFNTAPFPGRLHIIGDAIDRIDKRWIGYDTAESLTKQLTSMADDFDVIDNELITIEPWFQL